MGNKSAAKKIMQKAGVPVVSGSDGVVSNVRTGKSIAGSIGYPIMVKASAGGGGRGMRIVREASEFTRQFSAAGAEAEAAFGNGDLYIEKFVEEPAPH